jgi:type IV pilus assembly protein PilY1
LTNGLIGNWPIARAFEQDRYNTASFATGDVGTVTAKKTTNLWPFFFLPSTATNGATLRAYLGAGNRYSMIDDRAGTCRFDNPLACSKQNGCNTIIENGFTNRLSSNYTRVENHWSSGSGTTPNFSHASLTTGASSAFSACGTGEVVVNAGFTQRQIACTGAATPLGTVPANLGTMQVQCGKRGVDAGFYCAKVDGGVVFENDYRIDAGAVISGLGLERFYGVKIWDSDKFMLPSGVDGGAGTFSPEQYDNARFTDRGGDGGTMLVDVTNVGCVNGSCDGGAVPTSPGWFYEYSAINKKTASGSVVLAGCVLWTDMFPISSANDGGCGANTGSRSELFQADFITGSPNCAAGFVSSQSDGGTSTRWLNAQDVLVPPPEPAMSIMIGPNGKIKYSALIVAPGQNQTQEANIASSRDQVQNIYELPVSRDLHRCRHTDAGCL